MGKNTTQNKIEIPYIWFGGKRKVANIVWAKLGDVRNYIEPFYGGGAVHLLRPAEHDIGIETINDYDGFVTNFWRAVKHNPAAVAAEMNRPVNEIDLEARHRYLCCMPDKEEFLHRMKTAPYHYDIKRAAWWCWGLCSWIGQGWCGGEYHPHENGKSKGRGVCDDANKRPHLGNGRGVHRKLPHLADPARGVHRKRPHLGDAGQGEDARRLAVLLEWMQSLADRLRNTRVCCGDWKRVCTKGATSHGKTVGVFLDPPYSGKVGRNNSIYRCENLSVSEEVNAYCQEMTGHDKYRIVLAGYEGEHDNLEELGWEVIAWKTQGGFANTGKSKRGKANAHRERLWCSPSCLGNTNNNTTDGFFQWEDNRCE